MASIIDRINGIGQRIIDTDEIRVKKQLLIDETKKYLQAIEPVFAYLGGEKTFEVVADLMEDVMQVASRGISGDSEYDIAYFMEKSALSKGGKYRGVQRRIDRENQDIEARKGISPEMQDRLSVIKQRIDARQTEIAQAKEERRKKREEASGQAEGQGAEEEGT